MTFTPVAERSLEGLSLPIFSTYACRGEDSNTQPSTCEVNALTDYATSVGLILFSLSPEKHPENLYKINKSQQHVFPSDKMLKKIMNNDK